MKRAPRIICVDAKGMGHTAEMQGKDISLDEKCECCGLVKHSRRFVYLGEARSGPGEDEVT